ncbi:MAG: hypothetical protein VCB42_10735, partial [Myxococcota bacterium]
MRATRILLIVLALLTSVAAGGAAGEEAGEWGAGIHETATRYLVAAQEGAEPLEVADVEQPAFGEPYVTPFGTAIQRLTAEFHSNHAYSQLQAISSDSRHVLLTEDIATEISAKDVVRSLGAGFPEVLSSPTGVWGNPRWHATQANVLVHFDSNEDETLRLQETDVT